MKKLKIELMNLLEDNGFYCEIEMLDCGQCVELVKKASGDSYEKHVSEVFDNDFKKFEQLCKKLNLTYPDFVFAD